MFKNFRHLRIKQPLVILDAETTGVDPANDRIAELAILRKEPGKKSTLFHKRLNPQQPIPQGETAIHEITDKDVANSPMFGNVAHKVGRLLDPCNFVGFNIKRFDLPCTMKRPKGRWAVCGCLMITATTVPLRRSFSLTEWCMLGEIVPRGVRSERKRG